MNEQYVVATFVEGRDDFIEVRFMWDDQIVDMFTQIFNDYQIDAPVINNFEELCDFINGVGVQGRFGEIFRFTITETRHGMPILEG